MRKRRDLGQPSDIAFLLIIFFLLLAGINTTQSIALHTTTTTVPQAETEAVQALLTQQGTVVVGNISYTPLAFARELQPNTTLHLQVEAQTSWQQVVDLLSLSEQRQIAGLSLTLSDGSTTGIPSQAQEEGQHESQTDNQQETKNLAGKPETKQLEDKENEAGKKAGITGEMAL